MDIEWAASGGTSGVLNVRVYPPSPVSCHTAMTPEGPVRWSLHNETLYIDADRGLPAGTRGTEELIRNVMKSSGLAKRFSMFRMQAEVQEATAPGGNRTESVLSA